MTNVFQLLRHYTILIQQRNHVGWLLYGRVNACIASLEIEARAILLGSRRNDRTIYIHAEIIATVMPEKSCTPVNVIV
jgi:hypothetical protein